MVEAILKDRHRILPVSAYLQGNMARMEFSSAFQPALGERSWKKLLDMILLQVSGPPSRNQWIMCVRPSLHYRWCEAAQRRVWRGRIFVPALEVCCAFCSMRKFAWLKKRDPASIWRGSCRIYLSST